MAVDLSSTEPGAVTVTMDVFVRALGAVRVVAKRQTALETEGFDRRRRTTTGTFMEGDEITRISQTVTGVLSAAPGLRIVRASALGAGAVIQDARNPGSGCINIWIDRSPWNQMEGDELDRYLRPDELAAIEVYSGSNAPAEFQQVGKTNCATVVIWTISRQDRRR